MKVIQLISHNMGLYALSNTGQIFAKDSTEWKHVDLPPGCVTGPPPIPILNPHYEETELPGPSEPITVDWEKLKDLDKPAERKIDLNALPPKLRSVLTDGETKNQCPQCGMTLVGGQCAECEITPAGGGNYNIE